jgi:hypothetical protein
MPLCPQITNTPITVTQTADFTVSSVLPVVAATTTQLDNAIILIDGKTKAYYQATAPTSGMTEGDIWFDTDDGYKLYYYTGSAWTSVQDTSIAAAQSAATAAQTTANGKNKIYRQGTTPSGTFAVGDTWFNTSADNAISRWDGSSWVATTLGNNALASISASKITAGTIDASVITVSNLDAGNITTGYLAAARIAAASIDATKIVAGSITATQISSSYVYAGTIAAGNITTGTLSATVSLAAVSGTIGGFTLASTYLSGSGGFTLYSNGIIDGGLSNTIFYGYANIGGGTATGERFIVTGNSSFVGQAIFSGNTTSQTHFYSPYATNVTSAANGYWVSSSGRMTYTTASSQRYKHDIVDLVSIPEYDPKKLLNLPVRAFRYNEGYVTPTDDRAEMLIPGFIAEEVDAIYPIACDYSETKGPESWNDRIILPGMLALIQDLYKEIDTLKGA